MYCIEECTCDTGEIFGARIIVPLSPSLRPSSAVRDSVVDLHDTRGVTSLDGVRGKNQIWRPHIWIWGIGVRVGGGGGRLLVLKNFRASASCSKILNDKKYIFNAVSSGQLVFFRASASCSKILNGKKYIFNAVNSGQTLFSGQAQAAQK